MTCLDTKRSILDDNGFGGLEVASLAKTHKIGIGHRFAMTDGTILRGDHSTGVENIRINKIQFAKERGLTTTCNQDANEALLPYFTKHIGSAWHRFCLAHLHEGLRLLLVNHLNLPRLGMTSALFNEEVIDDLLSGRTFAEIEEGAIAGEAIVFAHDLIPCFRMFWHAVEEHAVHIEKKCF